MEESTERLDLGELSPINGIGESLDLLESGEPLIFIGTGNLLILAKFGELVDLVGARELFMVCVSDWEFKSRFSPVLSNSEFFKPVQFLLWNNFQRIIALKPLKIILNIYSWIAKQSFLCIIIEGSVCPTLPA